MSQTQKLTQELQQNPSTITMPGHGMTHYVTMKKDSEGGWIASIKIVMRHSKGLHARQALEGLQRSCLDLAAAPINEMDLTTLREEWGESQTAGVPSRHRG